MNDYSKVNNNLKEHALVKEKKILNVEFRVVSFSFVKLRDALYLLGQIVYEDQDNSIYVARINGGLAKRNTAYLAFEIVENTIKIAAYADEGIINQHTCEGVINEFRKSIKQYIRES